MNSLFNKVAGLMVYNFQKENPEEAFSCKFSEIFEKTCRTYPRGCLNEMNQKNLCFIYSQENTGEGVRFSAVAYKWAYIFSKRDSITDPFPWEL